MSTRFGSQLSGVRQAAGVLRAMAVRHNLVVQEADAVDLAAAVVGADAWMFATGAESLEQPGRFGRRATSVLTRVLLRASGVAPPGRQGPLVEMSCDDEAVLVQVDEYRRWAWHLVGEHAPEVLLAAAEDLAGEEPDGGSDGPFGSLACVLMLAADFADGQRKALDQ